MFLGIGRPPGQMDPKAFLLQNFNATAQGRVSLLLVFSSHQLLLISYEKLFIAQSLFIKLARERICSIFIMILFIMQ